MYRLFVGTTPFNLDGSRYSTPPHGGDLKSKHIYTYHENPVVSSDKLYVRINLTMIPAAPFTCILWLLSTISRFSDAFYIACKFAKVAP